MPKWLFKAGVYVCVIYNNNHTRRLLPHYLALLIILVTMFSLLCSYQALYADHTVPYLIKINTRQKNAILSVILWSNEYQIIRIIIKPVDYIIHNLSVPVVLVNEGFSQTAELSLMNVVSTDQ